MKLADIMNEWDKDSKIDEANLATESIGVPRLHSKYLRILTTEKVILNNLIIEKDSYQIL